PDRDAVLGADGHSVGYRIRFAMRTTCEFRSRRLAGRVMRRRAIRLAWGVIACALLALVSSTAASAAPDPFQLAAYAFRLAGTDGYEITVLASAEDPSGSGYVAVKVARPGAIASYVTRGLITANSIRADFGDYGHLRMAVHLSGTTEKLKVDCGSFKESF